MNEPDINVTPVSLTRVTVNLTPNAVAALARSAERESMSKTDTVNRALQAYDFIMERTVAGGYDLLLRSPDRESLELVHIV